MRHLKFFFIGLIPIIVIVGTVALFYYFTNIMVAISGIFLIYGIGRQFAEDWV